MKKLLIALYCTAMLFTTAGCNNSVTEENATEITTEASAETADDHSGLPLPENCELAEETDTAATYKTNMTATEVEVYYSLSNKLTLMSEEISQNIFRLTVVMDENEYTIILEDSDDGGSIIKILK